MIVVSDTTPLISLMKVGRLSLVQSLFGKVLIPGAVFDELVSNPRFLDEERQIACADYIVRVDIQEHSYVDLLRRASGLDAGESEAIWLCDTQKADILLMDEVKGRQVAKQMGLTVMGTIGMLMAAYESGFLSNIEVEDCITALKQNGRHISDALYQQLKERLKK